MGAAQHYQYDLRFYFYLHYCSDWYTLPRSNSCFTHPHVSTKTDSERAVPVPAIATTSSLFRFFDWWSMIVKTANFSSESFLFFTVTLSYSKNILWPKGQVKPG